MDLFRRSFFFKTRDPQRNRFLVRLCTVCLTAVGVLLFLFTLKNNQFAELHVHLPRKFFIEDGRKVITKSRFKQTEITAALNPEFRRQSMDQDSDPHQKFRPVSGHRRYRKRYMKHTLIEILDVFHQKNKKIQDVDCLGLFLGDRTEIQKAVVKMQGREKRDNKQTLGNFSSCDSFKQNTGYIENYLSETERDFPIAYSVLVYKDGEQIERLLRAIYRPQNFYCIHVDRKANPKIHKFISFLSECFPNVFLASSSIVVTRGTFSVLEADLICLKDLLKVKNWKYFITLTGQDFPLKTNYELVNILKAYNGSNDLKQTVLGLDADWKRKAVNVPYQLQVWKGTIHVVISRAFAEFTIFHTYGIEFLNWTRHFEYSDDVFFSSLSVPGVGAPGAYKGHAEVDPVKKPFLARYKVKNGESGSCSGSWYNQYCVFGLKDLPLLQQRKELFANKFIQNDQPYVLDCMEELIFNRTRDYYYETIDFNDTYYRKLDFVNNKV